MEWIAWSPLYCHVLEKGHKFPMEKYELIPQQLLYEGSIEQNEIFEPGMLEKDVALLTHDTQYWDRFINLQLNEIEMRRIGFPLSRLLVNRELNIMQGTVECSLKALKTGLACNIAGGTHHAFTNRGEGFCLLNDIAIAANYLLHLGNVQRIFICDLDVHQGNGTSQIFSNNKSVFTFSMHGRDNYPLRKEVSDLDIELPTGTLDEEYLIQLENVFQQVVPKFAPDFVFYNSGVDVLATDRFGKLDLSIEGCRSRDEMVFNYCYKNNIPVVAAMGGGYSKELNLITEAHCNTFRIAKKIFF